MISRILPYLSVFLVPFVITLALTPLVRELNRRLGMVDRPDPRRINKVPIPRGGGLALVLGVTVGFCACMLFLGASFQSQYYTVRGVRLTMLSLGIAALGLADDKFSLSPRLKLLGQLIVAFLVWWWAGLGFSDLWPALPAWVDCAMTMFWIVGAVNAFNLIDGLDGLASGLALIASLGMAGGLLFTGKSGSILYHLAFAGALLGFLRYNYNPASIFLGDCGSMFIGFVLSSLPLLSHAPNSFLVSVGVPLLAMGVPIFDTALAILRRSIRRLLNRGGASAGNGKVMTADADHLHHRILRSVGLSQRKAAWILYGGAIFCVAVGLVGANLKSHRAGLWLAAVTVAAVVIFRDMARVELFDAGRLLGNLAHDHTANARRRMARLRMPFFIVFDVAALVAVFFAVQWITHKPMSRTLVMVALPIRVFSTFVCLVLFRTYQTIWSRAMLSNYVRLFVACVFGSVLGTLGVYFAPGVSIFQIKAAMTLFVLLPFIAFVSLRISRSLVRDVFYAIDCTRLVARKDVSRVLVYGCGLRYRSFRRELVRTTAANDRIIVGLLDDDITLRGNYIGGLKVCGTLAEAPEIINELNADAVVIACQVTDEWLDVIRKTLAPTGVKVTRFSFSEKEI